MIKMVWMPQLLYLLHNSPVWLNKRWFRKIDMLFRELVWKKGKARISLHTLQLPTKEGGMAVPHPRSNFLAAQLQHLGGGNVSRGLMILEAPHKTVAEVLEADSFFFRNPTTKMTTKVWKAIQTLMGYDGFTEYAPLWHNRNLQEIAVMGEFKEWDIQGINRLSHLYKGYTLKRFGDLQRENGIPKQIFYRYLQMRHALNAQFKTQPLVWSNVPLLQKVIKSDNAKGHISEIYTQLSSKSIVRSEHLKCREKWEEDIGEITGAQWKKILELGHAVSVSPSQKISHLMLIHRAYYTPKKLYRFGLKSDAKCPRCHEVGYLIHMVWRCPKLFRYWMGVIDVINRTFGTTLETDARLCVLGYREWKGEGTSLITVVTRCLFQAQKMIAQRWQSVKPSTVVEWLKII